jgi:hypothetical protein
MTTARELVESGCCTASCLAAVTAPSRCKCPCRSELHGLLSGAVVDSLIDSHRVGLHRLTDLEVLSA